MSKPDLKVIRRSAPWPKLIRPMGTSVPYIAPVNDPALVFARSQSIKMRQMTWEGRVKPMASWGTIIARGLGLAVVAALVLWVVL